jgi:hypothetical protein
MRVSAGASFGDACAHFRASPFSAVGEAWAGHPPARRKPGGTTAHSSCASRIGGSGSGSFGGAFGFAIRWPPANKNLFTFYRAPLRRISLLGAHAAHRGYRGNSMMKCARSPPHVADASPPERRASRSGPSTRRTPIAASAPRNCGAELAGVRLHPAWLDAVVRVRPRRAGKAALKTLHVSGRHDRKWPHEAAELLRGVADDYAASPPPRQNRSNDSRSWTSISRAAGRHRSGHFG